MYDRITSRTEGNLDPNIRVGDADREATAERLRHHHAEGRIDIDEFQERLDRCYQATTAGQLQQLVADLPAKAQRGSLQLGRRRMTLLVPILFAILAIGAVTHDGHDHGPRGLVFVLVVFLVARLFLAPRRAWGMRGSRGGAGWDA